MGVLCLLCLGLDTTAPVQNFVDASGTGGTGIDFGNSIAVEASGNVYTTGYFRGTADFDPDTGVFNLTSADSDEIFVSKLGVYGSGNARIGYEPETTRPSLTLSLQAYPNPAAGFVHHSDLHVRCGQMEVGQMFFVKRDDAW